jgi:hypothetical protein
MRKVSTRPLGASDFFYTFSYSFLFIFEQKNDSNNRKSAQIIIRQSIKFVKKLNENIKIYKIGKKIHEAIRGPFMKFGWQFGNKGISFVQKFEGIFMTKCAYTTHQFRLNFVQLMLKTEVYGIMVTKVFSPLSELTRSNYENVKQIKTIKI